MPRMEKCEKIGVREVEVSLWASVCIRVCVCVCVRVCVCVLGVPECVRLETFKHSLCVCVCVCVCARASLQTQTRTNVIESVPE